MRGRNTILLLSLVALTACATNRDGSKPFLTAGISKRIAGKCDAKFDSFSLSRAKMPRVSFLLKSTDVVEADGVSRTVRCLGTALEGYRYETFGFSKEGVSVG